MHEGHRFATRLNSFASKPEAFWPAGHGKPTPLELAKRASSVAGLTDVDLNYPDHLGPDPRATGDAIRNLGLAVNGLAMRYYSNPAFKIGAFTNPDPAVRREAIDLTKRGIDAAREADCNLMTSVARPGRVRLRISGRLLPAVARRGRRHPRSRGARSRLPYQP